MRKFRIGQLVVYDSPHHPGFGVVGGVSQGGRTTWIVFDDNPTIQRNCATDRVRLLTRAERAVRTAKQAMGLMP